MSEKRFELHSDEETIDIIDNQEDEVFNFQYDVVSLSDAKRLVLRLNRLAEENEQLKKTLTKTEEEKEHYADLYNECRRLKLSNEAIRKAYVELNRKEREKHSQGNATYTRKSDLEVMY